MDTAVHFHFGWIDWSVVALYLVFTTWVGHALRGKQGTIRDFFLGGRTLPWQAVTGSIIATEISALTFIGVPGTVFAIEGDFTYLLWGLGSVIARFAVGYWLVPIYYQKEIYSPYDFMGARLGAAIKNLVTSLFSLGAILGQSVRVLVTAIVLKVVTGMPIELCIVVIGIFAVVWTLMGGMRTVIWTDVVQFFLFIGGGLLALIWLICSVSGGWGQIAEANQEAEYYQFEWKGGNPDRQPGYLVTQPDGGEPLRTIAIEKSADGKPAVIGLPSVVDGQVVVLIPTQVLNSDQLMDFEWKGGDLKEGEVWPEQVVLRRHSETKEPLLLGVPEFNSEGEFQVRTVESSIPAKLRTENKMQVWEARFWNSETKSYLSFTIWIALLAMPFQNFAAFGTDQLMAQRIFCCKNEKDARKAIVWSSISLLITLLMLMVSAGLYTWYQNQAISPSEFSSFVEDQNNVFPVWIVTVLPAGLAGLLIAGAFAAAISSLDSILAALSQTTLSAALGRDRFEQESGSRRMVWYSRIAVIVWGIILVIVGILLNVVYQMGEKDLINFAFGMVAYTYGPILGILLLAIFRVPRSTLGIFIGATISVALVAFLRPDIYKLLTAFGIENSGSPVKFPYPWFFPLNAGITFFCGWIFGVLKKRPAAAD
ncbi:MAG: Na+/proline symporter [Verrucomicrobiales bacterium]|jgi:Na+/proline symporter